MKFYLIKEYPVMLHKDLDAFDQDVAISLTGYINSFRGDNDAAIPWPILPLTSDQGEIEKCSRLSQLLEEKIGSATSSESAPWDMKLVLFFEDVLEHVLGVGHVYANVDLEATSLDSNNVLAVISKLSDGDALVTIRISQRATCEGDDALFDLNVVDIQIRDIGFDVANTSCERSLVPIPTSVVRPSDSNLECLVTVSVSIPDQSLSGFYKKHTTIDHANEICKEIYEAGNFSDVKLISASGDVIPAHKVFLARSDVLKRMLSAAMIEGIQSRITLSDMSTELIHAFLKFLYYGGKTDAINNMSIAFRLYLKADEFNLKEMQTAMRKTLLDAAGKEYPPGLAIQMFVFASKIEPQDSFLKMKAIKVLKSHAPSLRKTDEFNELFENDIQAAKELLQFALY